MNQIKFKNGFILTEENYKDMVADILMMTYVAKSGHPGGSLSSLPLILAVYSSMENLEDSYPIVISNGHVSPALYTVLSRVFNVYDLEYLLNNFRNFKLEGHVTRDIKNGVWWSTGSLGQGLSAACAFAYHEKYTSEQNRNVFCICGDGELQKGQINEALRFALKYNLNNLKILVDNNGKQICGDLSMFTSIPYDPEIDIISVRFNNSIIDNINKLIDFISDKTEEPKIYSCKVPMGYPISFMLNEHKYHGKPLNDKEIREALFELYPDNRDKVLNLILIAEEYQRKRNAKPLLRFIESLNKNIDTSVIDFNPEIRNPIEMRKALNELLIEYCNNSNKNIIFNDCDLQGSVGLSEIDKIAREKNNIHFIEHGIMEHHTSIFSGSLSTYKDNIVIWADFGMFGLDEVYNQLRMINLTSDTKLKLILTHVGINVGEDGKTHQCIDYLNLLLNLKNFITYIPVDANDLEQNLFKILDNPHNSAIIIPRSNDYICDNDDFISQEDSDIIILSYGHMVKNAIITKNILRNLNIKANIIPFRVYPFNFLDTEIEEIKNKPVFIIQDHIIPNLLESEIRKINKTCVFSYGLTTYSDSANFKDLEYNYKLNPEYLSKKIARDYISYLKETK